MVKQNCRTPEFVGFKKTFLLEVVLCVQGSIRHNKSEIRPNSNKSLSVK